MTQGYNPGEKKKSTVKAKPGLRHHICCPFAVAELSTAQRELSMSKAEEWRVENSRGSHQPNQNSPDRGGIEPK